MSQELSIITLYLIEYSMESLYLVTEVLPSKLGQKTYTKHGLAFAWHVVRGCHFLGVSGHYAGSSFGGRGGGQNKLKQNSGNNVFAWLLEERTAPNPSQKFQDYCRAIYRPLGKNLNLILAL